MSRVTSTRENASEQAAPGWAAKTEVPFGLGIEDLPASRREQRQCLVELPKVNALPWLLPVRMSLGDVSAGVVWATRSSRQALRGLSSAKGRRQCTQ
ncbi:hypothetical protein [Streptomyces sp. NPDC016845]|uniref:hypothetical protein n=1 Tax=Streptomyces sp. NPDC016845 TaxID=3364972 RepID=UPI00379FF5DC